MQMIQKYGSLLVVMFCVLVLVSPITHADTVGGTDSGIPNPLGVFDDITALIDAIIGFLITVGGALVAIIVIVGGYQILFAAGDPQKFATGKKTIIYAVVGYGIIWLSRGVVFLIQNVLQ